MNTLEKILHEIDSEIDELNADIKSESVQKDVNNYKLVRSGLRRAKRIINKHLSNYENKCGNCSRRKFFQIGYKEGQKSQYEKTMERFNAHRPKPRVSTPSKGDRAYILIGHTMPYKGLVGTIEYSSFDRVFYGKILEINDLVNYESSDVLHLCDEFKKSVDDYLSFVDKVQNGEG